ncbi:MAG: hypothetical protein V5A28_04950 [Haloarculaceae archaeon]
MRRIGLVVTGAAACLAALAATAGPDVLPTAVATAGLLVFTLGLVRVSRSWLSAGGLGLFAGGGAAMLAWDFGERAVNLGEQVGRSGVTRRSRAVHAGSSVVVALVGVLAGYATLAVAPGPLPLVALVWLCLAVVFLVAVLGV